MAIGNTVNPYSVTFTNTVTISEFSTDIHRVELRKGKRNNEWWVWMRVTQKKIGNETSAYIAGTDTKLTTPNKSVTGLPYGSISNTKLNSQSCSAAISVGNPMGLATVTYRGAASGTSKSKTVKV